MRQWWEEFKKMTACLKYGQQRSRKKEAAMRQRLILCLFAT